jgi:hypothetical protein
MTALIVWAVILVLAAGVGRRALSLFGVLPEESLGKVVFSAAIGLGVVAYLVLLIGLLGLLSRIPVAITLALIAALCWKGFKDLSADIFRKQNVVEPSGSEASAKPRSFSLERLPFLATCFTLVIAALVVLVNCFVPPGAHEWDALSYHLAAPKVYIQNHRIVYLPTDHHSNFPFLIEMLFTVGLLFDGYALANLFHFATGLLCVGAIFFIGKRHFSTAAAYIAVLTFVTTPIVLWEAGAAYIELGLALYVLLSVGAGLEFRKNRDPRWLGLAGVLMGFALGTKALALVPAFLMAVLLLVEGAKFKNLRWYLLGAVLVGCPFYIKSAVQTGNPVYPFAYRLFGGRDWNTTLADAYAGTQKGFGPHAKLITAADDFKNTRPDETPANPVERLRNMLLAPFGVIVLPRIYYDYFDPGFLNHMGFLYLSLPMLLLVNVGARRKWSTSSVVKWCGWFVFLWFLVWALTMQYTRYLIPLLPGVALLGGEGAVRAISRWKWMGWIVFAVIALQAYLALGHMIWVNERVNVLIQVARATDPQAQQTYLKKSDNSYPAIQWINENAPPNQGVVLYEETRGFYLDRPYLWGNALHSLYIPYPTFANGQEMADWFLSKGISYALVNLQFSHFANDREEGHQALGQAVRNGTTADLFMKWYDPNAPQDERWRGLLGEAIRSGAASFVNDASVNGVVVIQFRHNNEIPRAAGSAR